MLDCLGSEGQSVRVLASRESGAGRPGLSAAELERSRRTGQTPERDRLELRVRAAAKAAPTEDDFVRGLRGPGVEVRPWVKDGQIRGYAVREPGGVWFGGSKLGPGLHPAAATNAAGRGPDNRLRPGVRTRVRRGWRRRSGWLPPESDELDEPMEALATVGVTVVARQLEARARDREAADRERQPITEHGQREAHRRAERAEQRRSGRTRPSSGATTTNR